MTDQTRETIPTTGTAISLAEYLNLPETTQRVERIYGVIVVTPAPELFHQDIAGNVYVMLRGAGKGKVYIAPVDVVLPSGDVVQPDVLWLSENSSAVPDEGKRLRGAPELVVEILSPSTSKRDREDKFRLYETHGTREYWLIDPETRAITVWVREGDAFTQQGNYSVPQSFTSAAAGVRVSVADIFAD